MNTELKRRGSHDILIELLHERIPAKVGPEFAEFTNVWEGSEDDKRRARVQFEKLCTTIGKRLQAVSLMDKEAHTVQCLSNFPMVSNSQCC